MTSLVDELEPYHIAVCDAVVASVPDDWNRASLLLVRRPEYTHVGELEHSISNIETRRPVGAPDDSLFEATYRLDELFHKHGQTFRRAEFILDLKTDSWSYRVTYEYGAEPSRSE